MEIRFVHNDAGNPAGKLADCELRFADGRLAGLKLIGFAVWERRGGGLNVTFPARQYSVNGERRSFALLRPVDDGAPGDRLRDEILAEYRAWSAAPAVTEAGKTVKGTGAPGDGFRWASDGSGGGQ